MQEGGKDGGGERETSQLPEGVGGEGERVSEGRRDREGEGEKPTSRVPLGRRVGDRERLREG